MDPFDTPSIPDAVRVAFTALGPEFEARFDSECGACGGSIYEGDTIIYDGDDYAHTECVSD